MSEGVACRQREAVETCETLAVPGGGYADIEARKGKPGHGTMPKPETVPYAGRLTQQKEEWSKTVRESDSLMVLRDGRAVHRQGRGADKVAQPASVPRTGYEELDNTMQTSLRGKPAKRHKTKLIGFGI